ncbi:class I SAM-dependent methyltransferase [Moorena sp. SIO4G3]|uniref:class I SAM-dependent methyltransferase n=1 Tax=Moorena sp. SIO4G3 TaxID=2607821 RepID=UPI0014295576|nr:class I SAM-dependent methyltransferase [Moorena sp. SIO4G3]NEO77370.1 class I SAM-dependent methyltransferase [Moorena sp. SIO4G3]
MSQYTQKAFDLMAMQYDELIRLWVPWYDELIQVTANNLSCKIDSPRVLDLGCGTGNLSSAVLDCHPKAQLHVVDMSSQMVDLCKDKLAKKSDHIYCYKKKFNELSYNSSFFDSIVSQMAIHHLDDESKKELFICIYNWLKPGGLFSYSDIFCGADRDINENFISKWKSCSFELGASQEQWDFFMDHDRLYDKPIPLITAFDWLQQAGFTCFDVTWRQSLWSNIVAVKTENA